MTAAFPWRCYLPLFNWRVSRELLQMVEKYFIITDIMGSIKMVQVVKFDSLQ